MAMLNFKKGAFAALPKTISEGTIYVTTDEKAMYVDISATERIRLGQICVVDTVEAWEGLKPPFSQEAFYYIVESNALMRNNGTAEIPKWTQLNSVSDITADLTALTNRMDAVEKVASGAAVSAQSANEAAGAAQQTANEANALAGQADGKADAAQGRADDAYELAEEAKGIAEQGVADAKAADDKAGAAAVKANEAWTLADTANKAAEAANTLADTANKAAEAAQATADQGVEDAGKAQAAAEAAQTKANSAHDLANAANTLAGTNSQAIEQANKDIKANADAIDAQDERLKAVEDAIGEGDGTSLADRVGALEDTVNDATSGVAKNYERLNTIDTKFESYSTTEQMNSAINTKLADYSTTEQMNSAINTKLADYSTTEQMNTAIGAAKTEVTNTFNTKFESYSTTEQMNQAINNKLADYSTTEQMNGAINTKLADYSTTTQMNQAIADAKNDLADTVNTKFENYSTTEEMNTAIGAAKDEMAEAIESAIAENDAMTYKGVVTVNEETGEDDLPTSKVKIGDTYKVSKTGYYGPNDELCYVGDLLIANGTEGADGFIEGTITWDHVESGYEDDNQPILSGDNGNIYLTSPVAADADRGDLGKISVISTNENLKVSVASNAITMSLEWGSFEEE